MTRVPRVIEAGLRSFVCAYETYVEEPLGLGQLVSVREGGVTVLGVVADAASGPDDPTRPLQARGGPGESAADVMAANPEVRLLLRTRLTVVCCGHIEGEAFRSALPPTPPPLLARVERAGNPETVRFAADAAFLAMLVASPLCDDSVIAATIRNAARAFDIGGREFTVTAGKELARLLRAEPARLASILRGVAS
jgi:hypothetical protein